MKKNKVENSILLFIIIRSLFLLFFSKLSITDLILGSIFGLLLIIIYQKLNFKKYNLFKMILITFFSFISFLFLYNISYYIKDNILKNYSVIIIGITLLLLCIYIVNKGYHTLIKTMELSTYILIIMFIFSIGLLIPYIDMNNFANINYFVSKKFIYISLLIFLSFIAINYLNDYKLNYKVYLLSIVNIIFIKLLIIGILSQTLENVFNYPYISVLKKISYFDFFERLEGILALQYLFDYLFLLSLFILTIKTLIKDIFKLKIKTEFIQE